MRGFWGGTSVVLKRALFLTICLAVSQSGPAGAGSDRIYPTGGVTLHRGDQIVGTYTREAPLPEGVTIRSDGRCGVKLDDWYLVAEDKTVFSVRSSPRQRNLFIESGTLYFKTDKMNRALSFFTPAGPISVQNVRINAAFGASGVKGYLTVSGQQSELGVAEGGSMDVLIDDGLVTVQSGQRIILAQAIMDIGPAESEPTAAQPPAPAEPDRGLSSGQKIAVGALGVGAVAGVLIGLGGGGGGGGGGGVVSPSSP